MTKLSPAIIWALGATQVLGYGTLYYSFSVLAPELALAFGWSVEWVFGALTVALLLGGVARVVGGTGLHQVRGLGRRMPWTSFGIVVCGLSLIGVPGTAGFVSKWYLILAALEQGQWWLVFLIVLSSLLAVAYVWRFVESAYFRPPPPDAGAARLPWSMGLPAALLVAATVGFGLDTSFTVGAASRAAAWLMGATP